MNTRDEAIAWLVARSYIAIPRDWCLGKSICIAKRVVTIEPGIDAFEPTAVYVYPLEEGRWAVTQTMVPSTDVEFGSLQEAVTSALKQLDAYESYRLTNRCNE